MSDLRKRGYMTEQVATIDSCQAGGLYQPKKGSPAEAMKNLFKSFLPVMSAAIPSNFLKSGEKAVVQADTWGASIRGKGDGFEWSVDFGRNNSSFSSDYMIGAWVTVGGEGKNVSMNVGSDFNMEEVCDDIVSWIEKKIGK
jgi:hypothetical protein